MPDIHLQTFIAILIGLACWLDLIIRGCHTLLARMSLVILPLGTAIYLIVPMDVRHSSEADRVMFSIMCGIGVGGCLANIRHGHWGYRVYGWAVLVFWGLLINIILLTSISQLVNRWHWSPGWFNVLLLDNMLVLSTAVYISVTARRAYDQRTLANQGLCPACGYDLQGSAAATHCPECGEVI